MIRRFEQCPKYLPREFNFRMIFSKKIKKNKTTVDLLEKYAINDVSLP